MREAPRARHVLEDKRVGGLKQIEVGGFEQNGKPVGAATLSKALRPSPLNTGQPPPRRRAPLPGTLKTVR